jgi:NitT/TauT family transport system substrate-binding protein
VLVRRAAVLFGALLAPVAPALAQAPIRIRVASSPNSDLIAVLWGLESGAFRAAGLDVNLQKARGGADVAASVAGGFIEIGKSSLPAIVEARARGLPFVLVAPCGLYSDDAPALGMIVARDSSIRAARNLDAAIVAVNALHDLFSLSSQAWVDANGGNAKTLRFLEVPSAAMADAVTGGRVDAATMGEPDLGRALKAGRTRLLCVPGSAIARRFMQAAYFATNEYAVENRAAVTAFRHVVETAGAYANQHRDQMIPVIARFTGLAEDVIAASTRQYVGTSLDVRLITPVINVAKKYQAIPADFDVRPMVNF